MQIQEPMITLHNGYIYIFFLQSIGTSFLMQFFQLYTSFDKLGPLPPQCTHKYVLDPGLSATLTMWVMPAL